MPIVLHRIDERLIHGQVVLGWGNHLRPDRFIVVDEELAGSGWEQDLYRLGAGDAEVLFVGVEEARTSLDAWRADAKRSILLTRDVETMLTLARGGLLRDVEVNLGGIHHAPDREQVLTYLHLTQTDRDALIVLADEEGATVSARDLPDAHRVALRAIVGTR